jgi:hypothetical protein
MPSPIYQQFQQPNNFINMLNQFKQNPMAMLSRKFNIPQNMNDPNQILQHLLNSGQVSQEQVNRVMRMKNDPQFQNLIKN